ncbi:MAG TPA: hypothetical protein VIS96_01905 [Terrimicrobiaceae bacterium]
MTEFELLAGLRIPAGRILHVLARARSVLLIETNGGTLFDRMEATATMVAV